MKLFHPIFHCLLIKNLAKITWPYWDLFKSSKGQDSEDPWSKLWSQIVYVVVQYIIEACKWKDYGGCQVNRYYFGRQRGCSNCRSTIYHKEKQKQEEFLRNFLLVLNPLSVSFCLLPVNFQDENFLILKNKKQTNKMCRLSPKMTNS